ncbi:MAG: PKD domain-containing protein, partial [Anaerolineales bacterium]
PLLERELTPVPDFTTFQTYRVEWDTASDETRFYVNGSEVSAPMTGTTPITTWVWLDSQDAGRPISVDWVRAGQYPTTGGGYRSCVQAANGGGIVNWSNFNATTNVPVSTSLVYRTRTSVDGSAWSAWSAPLTSNLITSPSGRYFQYLAEFSNTTPLRSPELQQVVVNYFGPTVLQVLPNPANVNPRATQQFTAQALDVNSRPVTGLTYTWQLMAPAAGSLNSTGAFTAVAAAAEYINAISVTTPITGGTQLVGNATIRILDLPPTANANGPYTVNETAVLTLSGSGSDPNEGSVTSGWDLNNDGVFERPGASITNTWPDNGVITVGFIVTDTANLTTTVTTTVTVNNVAPTISNINNSGPITETSSVTVTVSASDVAGINDPLLYAFDCNNNGVFEIGPQSGSSANCTFGDNGAFTVPISVTDGDGGAATGVTTVTVTNVAPVIASVTNNGPVNEGSPVTVTVSASDVAGVNDPLQYAFDCDNNGAYETPASGNAGACTFFENGTRTIGVRVRDGDGGEATSNTVATINNVAPTIVALVNTGPITEGLSATIILTVTDPGGVNDPLLYAFDCNNDGNYEVGPQAGNTTSCLFTDNGVYTVRARVSDDELASSNDITEVTVYNAAPVIIAVNIQPVVLGNPSPVSVSATDAGGLNDPLQYEFDCDNNGTYESGPQSSSSFGCPAFPSLGTYTIRVRVTDGDGGVATSTGAANVVDVLKIFLPLVMRGNP